MKRTIRKDIRWNEYEIDTIESVLNGQDFSDFVRSAALDKAITLEHDSKHQ
jgi:hypothetical protein